MYVDDVVFVLQLIFIVLAMAYMLWLLSSANNLIFYFAMEMFFTYLLTYEYIVCTVSEWMVGPEGGVTSSIDSGDAAWWRRRASERGDVDVMIQLWTRRLAVTSAVAAAAAEVDSITSLARAVKSASIKYSVDSASSPEDLYHGQCVSNERREMSLLR